MQELIKNLLIKLGENPDREGLIDTPQRVENAYQFLTSGYHDNIDDILNNAVFESENNEMIIVKDIEFYSLCEHHMLPFFGKCHIGYLPNKKIIGLSKLARITDFYARRLQIQERLTTLIAECLEKILDPIGIGVIMEGRHLCMMMRGVQKQNSYAITSALRGGFKSDSRTRNEFINLIRKIAPN